jgi:hypothetical protein
LSNEIINDKIKINNFKENSQENLKLRLENIKLRLENIKLKKEIEEGRKHNYLYMYNNKYYNYKLKDKLSEKLRDVLSSSDSKYHDLLGCTTLFFKKWIEFQFQKNMTWDNYGVSTKHNKKWGFDHIIAYNNFDLANEYEKMLCVHWTNIQPMWGYDNCAKSENIELHHFMNSIINVHRFIQLNVRLGQNMQIYIFSYANLRNRINWLKRIVNINSHIKDSFGAKRQ